MSIYTCQSPFLSQGNYSLRTASFSFSGSFCSLIENQKREECRNLRGEERRTCLRESSRMGKEQKVNGRWKGRAEKGQRKTMRDDGRGGLLWIICHNSSNCVTPNS